MSPTTKKYLTWIAIALVLFYVLRDPQQAADSVQGGLRQLQTLAEKVVIFLQALVS